MNELGRCCGRKPISYKRPPRLFCPRCDRAYDPATKQQIPNWAWKLIGDQFIATYPNSDYAKLDTPDAE